MLKLPNVHQLIIVNILIAMIAIYIQLDANAADYAFDAQAINSGSWWLFVTGNFFHLNAIHMIANLAYLVLITYVFQPKGTQLFIAIIQSSLAVGLLAYLFDIQGMIGMTGVLHALTVYLALYSAIDGRKEYWIILFALTIKVAHETAFGISDNISWLLGGEIPAQIGLIGIYAALLIFIADKAYEAIVALSGKEPLYQ